MTNTKWSPTIDTRNRLDAKNPDREGALTENPHMQAMHDIRSKLKLALHEIPDCPPVASMDELFTEAEKVVHMNWQKHVSELLSQHREDWLKATEGNEELKELNDILSNDKIFEEKLRFFQLGPLEPLRTIAPEAWYQLLLASSERQLAQIVLLNHWVKKDPEKLPRSMGMTPEEVQLVLDMGNIGKFVNMAFLKQTELADTTGGSEASGTELGSALGGNRLYEVYEKETDEQPQVKTYGEMFKGEWGRLVGHMNRLSEKVKLLLEQGKIPASYKGLPAHLKKLAEVYGSDEKDPEKLTALWDEVDKSCRELGESGCPVSVIGQACAGVAGEANKADIEVRVGLKDRKAEAFEKTMQGFHESAQGVLEPKEAALAKPVKIPVPQVNRQLFFFGTNMAWETPADTREEATNIHYNTITKEGMVMKPVLDKVFPESQVSKEAYKKAFVLDTALHELGHGILSSDDTNMTERIGTTDEAGILEELKAETLSLHILRETMKKKKEAVDVKAQAMAKLAVIMDYLLNKSSEKGSASERYYYTGVAIVKDLLDKGILKETNGAYSVTDPVRMIDAIGDLGVNVLGSYYENNDSSPEAVTEWGEKLREMKSDPKVAAFLRTIQQMQAA